MALSSSIKRKRSGKTSSFQYETYLEYMKECSILRSGILIPTLPPNYIKNKWEEMTSKLNTCDHGPVLSAVEWQKRFNNWKNSTRQKWRQLISDQKMTGGGPSNEKNLTALEERGLSVWGRVAVTGTPKVKIAGGLQMQKDELQVEAHTFQMELTPQTEILDYEIAEECPEIIEQEETTEEIKIISDESKVNANQKIPINVVSGKNLSTSEGRHNLMLNRKRKFNSRSTKDIGIELLNSYKNEKEVSNNIEMEKIKIEKVKLLFEIAKYKFENPDFSFQSDLLDE